MRKVALVGFGPTRKYAYDLPDDFEIWTLNNAETYDFPRIDRLFEMHPVPEINNERRHEYWEWLKSQPFPILMLDTVDEIPTSIRYPIERVMMDLDSVVVREEDEDNLYTSSFCYMIALAIHEKVDFIKVCGFDMSTETEYVYQREGAAHLLGVAKGRGIVYSLPRESPLLQAKLYGYEQGQMLSRQTLEAYTRYFIQEHELSRQMLNKATGTYETLLEQFKEKDGTTREEVLSASAAKDLVLAQGLLSAGAFQAMNKMIEICDLKEPGPELFNPFMQVELADEKEEKDD